MLQAVEENISQRLQSPGKRFLRLPLTTGVTAGVSRQGKFSSVVPHSPERKKPEHFLQGTILED